MNYTQASQGRIFVIRLKDGEILHETIEDFAREQKIRAAMLIAVGGARGGSRLVVGPEDGEVSPPTPMEQVLKGVHEIAATGTLFPDEKGAPILHMHAACGRKTQSITGCVRQGVRVWHICEVILIELLDVKATRIHDPVTGFTLLEPE